MPTVEQEHKRKLTVNTDERLYFAENVIRLLLSDICSFEAIGDVPPFRFCVIEAAKNYSKKFLGKEIE